MKNDFLHAFAHVCKSFHNKTFCIRVRPFLLSFSIEKNKSGCKKISLELCSKPGKWSLPILEEPVITKKIGSHCKYNFKLVYSVKYMALFLGVEGYKEIQIFKKICSADPFLF